MAGFANRPHRRCRLISRELARFHTFFIGDFPAAHAPLMEDGDARRAIAAGRVRSTIEPRPSGTNARNATPVLPRRIGALGFRGADMTDNATIAAILASGMLPPLLAPATDADGVIGADERARFVMDVLHAVGLYKAVLEALATQAQDQPLEFGSNVRRIRLCDREPSEGGMQTDPGGEGGDRTGEEAGSSLSPVAAAVPRAI